ncbi:CD36 antigen family-containing protein [Strongyloides ratti]|uniref:CD36 antigen family-containing protein n=1 Tax=Strongyloides ratti TaxID=34506 RepID=A0A090MYE9_STRRB|nr:CD36 antigen family-containing protein [Strongyloides ratti]CEF67064.1 CD36 antigen family-containing protein [Strongyloides ratti]
MISLNTSRIVILIGYINNVFAKMDYLGRDENGTYNAITKAWQKPIYNMSVRFYFYSVKNSKDIYSKGDKPILEEIGPYYFDERQEKMNIKFLENDTKIEYENHRFYYFNESLSCKSCSLDDYVVIPSVVFQKIAQYSNHFFLRNAIDVFLKTEHISPFINITVREALFEGYKDPILRLICSQPLLSQICDVFKIDQKIGFFYNKNGTSDGVYTIDTGLKDRSKLSHIYGWNGMYGKLDTTYWYGEEARIIRETDGQMYPPNIDSSKPIIIFAGQACRSIVFDFEKKNNFEGVKSYMYTSSKSMSNMQEEKRKGFCDPSTPRYFNNTDIQIEGCHPNGLIDASVCVPDAPKIYISPPHFTSCPPEMSDKFTGISNDTNDDVTYLEIEPDTGVTIHVESRSQINLGMLNKIFQVTSKQDNLIFPIFYMKESISMDSQTREELMHGISFFNSIAIIIGICCLFASCVVLSFGLWSYYKNKSYYDSTSENSNLVENEETETDNPII